MRSLGVPGDTGGEGGVGSWLPLGRWDPSLGPFHLSILGRKIEEGEGCWCCGADGCGGLPGEQEGGPAVKTHFPHQDPGLALPSRVLPNAAVTHDGE